jgi:hypothetical protein
MLCSRETVAFLGGASQLRAGQNVEIAARVGIGSERGLACAAPGAEHRRANVKAGRRSRRALLIAGGGGNERHRRLALVAGLAKMRLHAVLYVAHFGVRTEVVDIRCAFLRDPRGLRQP